MWEHLVRNEVAAVTQHADAFDPDGLLAFRKLHSTGVNLVVSANADNAYTRSVSGLEVSFCSLAYLRQRV